MTMSRWPRPLATNCNLFILGSKWTFVLNLMKLLLMKVLQRYRGDKNVMGRWYDSSHHSCGRHRGIKHLYVFPFMCISWRFDDGETAFRCSASSGHTLLIARVSIRDVFVCVNHLFSARSQPRWLNVSECHTYMIARSSLLNRRTGSNKALPVKSVSKWCWCSQVEITSQSIRTWSSLRTS